MSIENRPYVGTWRLNNRQVVKHTPDALVYVNGDLSLPGCPSCNGKIDLQKYITQVSVDPSTEGPSTASISLHIPRHVGDPIFRDGNSLLRPGLEIHIYLRGYFPTRGLTSHITPEQSGGVDVQNAVQYPYYMVFHGVVTDVQHQYSGGEHTASLSCADMLHFWQYQRMSTNGSAFGARPTNSKVKMSLVGHNMTGMSPYAIIYTLYRDVQGSAGGVEFALGSSTNASANSTVLGESMFSLSILYWQKRFSQSMMSLRMYGADGTLFPAFQAAFLSKLSQKDAAKLAESSKTGAKNAQSNELDPMVRASRLLNYNPYAVDQGAAGASGNKDGALGVNVAQISAFASDISQWGSVNLFESRYAPKMEIANIVKEAVGFEFYQDVDGDIVFKPPFYNLDTSNSRVYRIKDIDIISFSVSEKEPEATVVKATGGHFKGMTGFGLENNEWGTRAEFIDYRMVAQFGWREQTFETTYHTNPQAIFFACIARYDLFNIGVKSATLEIPLRPELRPGYPIYIESLDCYYYIHSFSHSFNFGGQCTTSINLVGKRGKFYAPGVPPADGSKATVANIRLDNTHLPPLPLEVIGNDGIPRLQGFPNVVMTIDPEAVNPLSFARSVEISSLTTEASIQQLIDTVLAGRNGILQQDTDDVSYKDTDEQSRARKGPFKIQTGSGTWVKLGTASELVKQASKLAAVYGNKKAAVSDVARVEQETEALRLLVDASRDVHARMFTDDVDSTATYLELLSDLKATYNPGGSTPGAYRYYSDSHPDPTQQGPRTLNFDPTTGQISTGSPQAVDSTVENTVLRFNAQDDTNQLTSGRVQAGIPVAIPGTKGEYKVTPTHQITTFNIATFNILRAGSRAVSVGSKPASYSHAALSAAYKGYFTTRMGVEVGPSTPLASFQPLFNEVATNIETNLGVAPVYPANDGTLADLCDDGVLTQIQVWAETMADVCARTASTAAFQAQNSLNDPSANSPKAFASEKALAEAWAKIWPDVFAQPNPAKKSKSLVVQDKNPHYVPVFPVSDEKGYEVIGTYRYGRGLTMDSLGQIDGFVPSSDVNYDQVETFLNEIMKTGANYAKAVGTLDAPTRAALAATVSASAASGNAEASAVLEILNAGGTQIDNGGAATPVNANTDTTQKWSVVNAAYGLADMNAGQSGFGVCACKGAEADVLLQAFNNEFVQIDGADSAGVQDWLEEQALLAGSNWQAQQDAYRGSVFVTQQSASGVVSINTPTGVGSLFGAEGAVRTTASALQTAITNAQNEDEG